MESLYLHRSSLDNKKRGYSYVYDRLNRLTLAALKDPDLTISSNDTPYGEKLTYDKNGNILKLTRNGASVANKVTQIDNLTYSYEAGSNKLSKVVDASGNLEGFKKGNTTTSADYTYDVFGNLTVDRNKNITKISYNSLHLPVELNIGSNKIAYLYDASGKKVQKKVIQGTSSSTTDYLNGFQYVDNVLSFIPTSEGFFDFKTNKYVYQYVDQLGNVRLSYSDKDGNNKIEATEIIEQINYYPFGLAHKGYNQKNDPLMKDFKYQYNGKENQEELGLNVYDYGARNYDAAIGRWMNVDPLAEQFEEWNPYSYTFNNPINFIDPTGMAPESPDCDGCKGFLFTVIDNVLGTNLRNTSATDSPAYRAGVQTGHTASLAASVVLAIDGGTNVIGGTAGLAVSGAVAVTGVGAMPAASTAAVSGLMVVKGTTEVAAAAHIGSTTVRNMNEDKAANLEDANKKGIPSSQLGPSGKPKVHNVSKSNLKGAKDAARNNAKSNTKPVKHSSDKGQKTHYDPTRNGEKMSGKDNIHYVNRNSKRNER